MLLPGSSAHLRTSKTFVVIGSIAAAAGGAVLYTFDPAVYSFYPPCVFRALTGLLCAGCGATRAAHQLLHGNVAEAMRLNAMFVVGAPLFLFGAAAEASAAMRGRTLALIRRPWIAWAIVVILIGWGVLRNVIAM